MEVFKHLRDVRFWGAKDRLGQDIVDYWNDHLAAGDDAIRFEIEAWCFASQERNQRAAEELTQLIGSLDGRILRSALITEIAYHGFLVELPADGVRQLLNDSPPELVLSDRVMFSARVGRPSLRRSKTPAVIRRGRRRHAQCPALLLLPCLTVCRCKTTRCWPAG